MDVHHLKYFLAVRDHGSVSAAASAVGVAQPTVSQAVRALERELGTPLFHRIGRGMVPTSAGQALVASARRILRGVVAAEGAVSEPSGRVRGRLDIVSYPATSTGALPTLVTRFRRHHPEVSISIGTLAEDTPAATPLRSGTCEIVVAHLPVDETGGRPVGARPLDVLELGVQEYWLAYPPGSDPPEHDPIGWDELPDSALVVVPPGGSHADEIERTMAAAGRLRPPAAVLQNREARLSFALAGVGATFVERSLAGLSRSRGAAVRAFSPPLGAPFGLVFDAEELSPAAAAFVGLARSWVDAQESSSPAADAVATNARPAGDS